MHPVKEDALRYDRGQRGCSGVKRISNLHHFDLLGRYIGCLPNNEYQDDDEQTAEVFFTSKLSQVVYRCCLCSHNMMQSGLNLCHNAASRCVEDRCDLKKWGAAVSLIGWNG